jgi:hypothetical protein
MLINDARLCWSGYAKQKSILISIKIVEADARASLRKTANVCSRKDAAVEDQKRQFAAQARSLVEAASNRKAAADRDLAATTTTVTSRVESAGAVEREAVNERSATVLADLLATDRGSLAKWLLFTIVVLNAELLPFWSKMLAGKTNIGLRLGASRKIEALRQNERIATSKHDTAIAETIGITMREAVLVACTTPEIKAHCASVFGRKLTALVPFEVVSALLHEIEARQLDINDAMRRFPKYSGVISQAWTQAVHETAELLKSESFGAMEFPGSPTNPGHENTRAGQPLASAA